MFSSKPPFSLERHIRYRLLLLMVPVFLLIGFLVHKGAHLLVDEVVVERLKDDGESLIAAVEKKQTNWVINDRYTPLVYQRVRSGHYFILKWDGGMLRSRSLWDKPVDTTDFIAGDTEDYLYYKVDDEYWVIHKRSFTKANETLTLWIAEDISAIDNRQKLYEMWFWGIFLLLGGAFILWQRHVLNNGFRKLIPVQEAIKGKRDSGEIAFPEDIPDEIEPLVQSIRVLVESSMQQTSRLRMSVGNLAHELKRPLQMLHIIAAETTDTQLKQQLLELSSALKLRIDAELKRARISGSPMPGHRFSCQQEIGDLCRLLERIHDRKLDFFLDFDGDELPFERDDMLELLGNLLDNAWRFAKGQVTVKIWSEGDVFFLQVDDDGAGVPTDKLALINRRGVRVDEAVDTEGAGLGLSICQSIAESYSGSMQVGPSHLGGLNITVKLHNKWLEEKEGGRDA